MALSGFTHNIVIPHMDNPETVSAQWTFANGAGVRLIIKNISQTSGTIPISQGYAYTATLSGATTFVLPSPNAGIQNTIRAYIRIATTIEINFGTNYYSQGVKPLLTAGYYLYQWDYDAVLNQWALGSVKLMSA